MWAPPLPHLRSYGIMDRQNCGVRNCPFPAIEDQGVCRYHRSENEAVESWPDMNSGYLFQTSSDIQRGDAFSSLTVQTRLKLYRQNTLDWDAENRCLRCGAQRDRYGKTCLACRKDLNEMTVALRRRRVDEGRCPRCDAPQD